MITAVILLINNASAESIGDVINQLQQQNWAGAIAAAREGERTSPNNSALCFLKGIAQYQINDYGASRESLSRAISLGKISGEVFYYRGIDNLYLKDYKNSVKDFTTALRDPNVHIKLTNLFTLLRMKDDPQQVLATIYVFRAIAHMNSGQYQEGLDDINKSFGLALSLSYSNYKIKGDLLFLTHQYQEAYENYLKSIDLNSNLASTHYSAGLLDMYFGNYSRALVYLEKSAELDPDYLDAGEKIGLCLLFTGNMNGALNMLLKNYDREPNAYNAFYLGYVYRILGNTAKAKAFYREAIGFDPNILGIMKFIYQRLPESSATRHKQLEMTEAAERFIEKELEPEITITAIRLSPDSPRINEDFKIIINIAAMVPGGSHELRIPFYFTIDDSEKPLFSSPKNNLVIINGKSGEWIEQMNGVPVSGDFILTVIAEFGGKVIRRQRRFRII